jgi:excinuclease ABC subunit C
VRRPGARDDYAESVRARLLFLDGRSDELSDELGKAMEAASGRLDFEEAARLRDLMQSIRSLQARQYVDGRAADSTCSPCAMQDAAACVLLLAFRDGATSARAPSSQDRRQHRRGEVLAAFVSQYYAEQAPPREIVLDRDIPIAS